MLKLFLDQRAKFIASFWIVAALMFFPAPCAKAASIAEILLGGTVEYIYMQKYLSAYHYSNNKNVMDTLKKQNGVNNDERANEELDRAMTNLLKVVGAKEEVKPEYSWFVNNQTSFNAFCAIGNNVSVNIGLFEFINYNEDQLAFVLAHEIVHGQKQHVMTRAKKSVPLNVVKSLYMAKNPNLISSLLSGITSNALLVNSTTLPNEKEADAGSFDYAVDAGYNPGAGAAIWVKLTAKHGDNAQSSFEKILNPNDHPTNAQRVAYFANRLHEYSYKKVKVQDKTVYVCDKPWVTPLEAGNLLAEERAYFIAGNLAAIFHEFPLIGLPAYAENGLVKIDGKIIMTPVEGEQGARELANSLNEIMGF